MRWPLAPRSFHRGIQDPSAAAQTLGRRTAHPALVRNPDLCFLAACSVEITCVLLCFPPKDGDFPTDISPVLLLSVSPLPGPDEERREPMHLCLPGAQQSLAHSGCSVSICSTRKQSTFSMSSVMLQQETVDGRCLMAPAHWPQAACGVSSSSGLQMDASWLRESPVN